MGSPEWVPRVGLGRGLMRAHNATWPLDREVETVVDASGVADVCS